MSFCRCVQRFAMTNARVFAGSRDSIRMSQIQRELRTAACPVDVQKLGQCGKFCDISLLCWLLETLHVMSCQNTLGKPAILEFQCWMSVERMDKSQHLHASINQSLGVHRCLQSGPSILSAFPAADHSGEKRGGRSLWPSCYLLFPAPAWRFCGCTRSRLQSPAHQEADHLLTSIR